MSNKEECEKAFYGVIERSGTMNNCCSFIVECMKSNECHFGYLGLGNTDDCADYKCFNTIKQLIKEHFDDNGNVRAIANIVIDKDEIKETVKEMVDDSVNKILNPQPYKFEDLKKEMWVWDDKKMDFYHVCEKIVNKDGTKILANETHYRLFEENRFFPITKALQYQGKEDASK